MSIDEPAVTTERQGATRAAVPRESRHALTIDVEDYFQVEAFATIIDRSHWDAFPSRVVRNTERLLDLLSAAGTNATFFTLGWVAVRYPALARRILSEGHELASHGLDHQRAALQSADEFRSDVRRSKAVLEDVGGVEVLGYRAPTFSIGRDTPWAHSILAEEGFRYSSSVYPVAHDLYGMPNAPRRPFFPQAGFMEIPLTTIRVAERNFPAAGGGFFRLLPYRVTRLQLVRAAKQLGTGCVFYLHPWEIDPDQPRQMQAPLRSRFRHYLNLSRTEQRLKRLLCDFNWARMDQTFLGVEPQPPLIESWLSAAA